MILQVLVQWSGNRVFDRCLHCMSRKPRPCPLAEAGCPAAPLSWVIGCLSDSGASHNARYCLLTESAFLPMSDIRMTLAGNDSL
jgi:hypothetical protein